MVAATSEVTEKSFPVGIGAELTVSTVSGRVDVSTGRAGVIDVRATKRGSARAMEQTFIDFAHEGNRVSVRTRTDRSSLLTFVRSWGSVDYEITVPPDCAVHVNAVSADVVLARTRAQVNVQTVSGDVSIQDHEGDCSITTVSGDIVGSRLRGPLHMRTTSGGARIVRSRLQRFNLASVSGDATIETSLAQHERYFAKTTSGDVRIAVPPGTGATVQMKSVSGRVASSLPGEVIKAGRRHWQSRINGGGAHLEMVSVSGDLRIVESNDLAPHSQPDHPPESQADVSAATGEAISETPDIAGTSDVLAALERGQISVEEAMAILEGPS